MHRRSIVAALFIVAGKQNLAPSYEGDAFNTPSNIIGLQLAQQFRFPKRHFLAFKNAHKFRFPADNAKQDPAIGDGIIQAATPCPGGHSESKANPLPSSWRFWSSRTNDGLLLTLAHASHAMNCALP